MNFKKWIIPSVFAAFLGGSIGFLVSHLISTFYVYHLEDYGNFDGPPIGGLRGFFQNFIFAYTLDVSLMILIGVLVGLLINALLFGLKAKKRQSIG